jgi:hypothetical protein
MSVKFGTDQINSPAPKWWRNFERAYIIVLAPATTGFLVLIGSNLNWPDSVANIAGGTVMFTMSVVKAIGMFLGTGEEYPDEKQINQ